MAPRTFVSTRLPSSGPGHHHRDDKFHTSRLCGLEPSALSRRHPPGGRALDWGHCAPPQGGKPKKKECQIKTQTGDRQKFATVARAHGQAKPLGHKRANINDAPPPRPPNVNVATVRSSAGLRTFVRKRPARTTVHIATTLRLGGLWGAAVATKSRHWYLEKLRTSVVQQSP